MKLKDSTFAIIAEKQDSISHRWFKENPNTYWPNTYWYWNSGCYYQYDKGEITYFNPKANEYPDKNIPIYTESEFEALLKAEQDSIKDELVLSIEANEKITADAPILTDPQIEGVISWMNTWEQLRDTAIPLRFKEDFKNKLKAEQDNEATQTFGGKDSIGKTAQTFPAKGGGNITLEGFSPLSNIKDPVKATESNQVVFSYHTAIDLLAYYTKIDKGIIKIEMP